MSEQPFRFLDLPIELRFCIYESISMEIRHIFFSSSGRRQGDESNIRFGRYADFHGFIAVKRCFPFAILATCRMIRHEAEEIVDERGRRLVMDAPPKMIIKHLYAHPFWAVKEMCRLVEAIEVQCDSVAVHGIHAGITTAPEKACASIQTLDTF